LQGRGQKGGEKEKERIPAEESRTPDIYNLAPATAEIWIPYEVRELDESP
jgi:hypothetical protein